MRPHKPWFRKQTKTWYVQIDGRQYNLGRDKEKADDEFHRLMLNRKTVTSEHLAVILDKFLTWTEAHRPKSLRWYTDYLQSFTDCHPALLASELKPFHVEEWASKGKGKRGKITALKRALNWAVEMGHLTHSPIAKLRRPALGTRDRVISRKEFATILRIVDRNFGKLLRFVYYTGARPQEAVAAHHDNLQGDRLVWLAGKAPKGKAPRIIYLNKRALRLINPEGFFFTNSRGKPWKSNDVRCRFRRLEEKLGERLVLYHFRHSFCHNLLSSGVDSLTVSVLMGHKSPVMVGAVYSHLNQADAHLRDAISKL